MTPLLIRPDWPAPPRVRAAQTTRIGGFSQGVHAGFNLGTRCGDDPGAVAGNRRLLAETLQLPAEPGWLQQVHGAGVVRLPVSGLPEADASIATGPGQVCVAQTADCLPVLFCDDQASVVAAAHAGWRGLAGGVLEATIAALPVPPARLLAWLGPAIGPSAFEVGPEVRQAFVDLDPGAVGCFQPAAPGKFLADLYALARRRLARAGVDRVYGGGLCTHGDAQRFYSFRRDARCGRMASLVWLA
ncbi:MAG TPA: peptidoglycan editing factor PgeF [Solimonas sp.]|nr:peptidoglycan editing factor PgeF [Solimonas sp.]